jgi:predicted deacylase
LQLSKPCAPQNRNSKRLFYKNRKNFGTRFLGGTVFLFILVFVGGTGCAALAVSTELNPTSPIPITSPASTLTYPPSTTPLSSAASLTSTTATNPPLPTRTPRPTATSEPTSTPMPQPLIIGYSVAGRPLEVYHFGNGPSQRLIVAGIHGGYEWNTIALADQLIDYLNENPGAFSAKVTLYILRAANPDGEARAHGSTGRANENGVDINRNFPANWAADWDRRGCWNDLPITAGTRPMSEPETGAIMQFILGNRIEALINYHSAALGIFAGGQPVLPESHDLAQTLAAVTPYTYPPPYDTGCEYTGQLADWAANHNIPAVDIELTNHEDSDFSINLKILEAFLNWQADN